MRQCLQRKRPDRHTKDMGRITNYVNDKKKSGQSHVEPSMAKENFRMATRIKKKMWIFHKMKITCTEDNV